MKNEIMRENDRRRRNGLLALAAAVALSLFLLMGLSPKPKEPDNIGELQITPAPVDACGMPPSAEDFGVLRADGTVNKERSLEFAYKISEWDMCMTNYAEGLRDFVFILEGIRDSTIQAAGVYYQQFVDPHLQPPPGLFDPHEG